MLVKGEAPQKRKRTTPTTCRRDSGSAVTNARFIAVPRPLAGPSPSRAWSLRCIPLALVTDGLDDMRFRLGIGCATLHCGHLCAMRSAPALRSAPARRRPQTNRSC